MTVTLNLWLDNGRETERVAVNPADVASVTETERVRRGGMAKVAVVLLTDGRRYECFDGDRAVKARLGK